ncbi:TPA: nucleotidyltransferase, partial [Patescibacteria group bacterium]|nr:nucleotidyltransferase [Patescibacteria group bacterium]
KINKKIINEVQRFIVQIRQAKIPFEKVILFGSQAKGTAREYSDIDVCVISKSFGENRHTERVKLMLLKNEETIDIEPHPYHPRDFADKWDSLAHEIKQYGIVIK